MLQNIWPFGLAMFCHDMSERINRFLKHVHNEHNNRGGQAIHGNAVHEVSRRKCWTILREASVQAQSMTWLFAYFDVSWVVHGGPRLQVRCSGRDAMEVRRGQGNMLASLGYTLHHHGQSECQAHQTNHGAGILPCVLALI